MTSHPDPLFRKNLDHYQKVAPSSAWDRIEAGLDRKREKSIWMKLAAGLLILLATSILFLKADQTEPSIATNSKQSPPTTLTPDTSFAENKVIGNRDKEIVAVKKTNINKGNPIPATMASNEVQIVSNHTSTEKMTDPIAVANVEVSNMQPEKEVIAETKGTNITYTAEEVNLRFSKQIATAEATQDKKSASGIQKVIDKAIDLTNEGSVYAEIREKKNEWLSFNIASNKRESNK